MYSLRTDKCQSHFKNRDGGAVTGAYISSSKYHQYIAFGVPSRDLGFSKHYTACIPGKLDTVLEYLGRAIRT